MEPHIGRVSHLTSLTWIRSSSLSRSIGYLLSCLQGPGTSHSQRASASPYRLLPEPKSRGQAYIIRPTQLSLWLLSLALHRGHRDLPHIPLYFTHQRPSYLDTDPLSERESLQRPRPTNRVLLLAGILRGLWVTYPEVDVRDLDKYLPDPALVKSLPSPPQSFSNEVAESLIFTSFLPTSLLCRHSCGAHFEVTHRSSPKDGLRLRLRCVRPLSGGTLLLHPWDSVSRRSSHGPPLGGACTREFFS